MSETQADIKISKGKEVPGVRLEPVKLKRTGKRNFVGLKFAQFLDFVPESIVIQLDPNRNNTIIMFFPFTDERISEEVGNDKKP